MEDSLKAALAVIGLLAGALIWLAKRRGKNGNSHPQIPKHMIEYIDGRFEHAKRGTSASLELQTEKIKDHENRIRALEAMSYEHPKGRR